MCGAPEWQDFVCTDVVHAHQWQNVSLHMRTPMLETMEQSLATYFPGHHCGVVHATLCGGRFVPSERRLEGLCAMGPPAQSQLLSDITTLKRSPGVHSRGR